MPPSRASRRGPAIATARRRSRRRRRDGGRRLDGGPPGAERSREQPALQPARDGADPRPVGGRPDRRREGGRLGAARARVAHGPPRRPADRDRALGQAGLGHPRLRRLPRHRLRVAGARLRRARAGGPSGALRLRPGLHGAPAGGGRGHHPAAAVRSPRASTPRASSGPAPRPSSSARGSPRPGARAARSASASTRCARSTSS